MIFVFRPILECILFLSVSVYIFYFVNPLKYPAIIPLLPFIPLPG